VPAVERAGGGCTGLASAWRASTTTTPGQAPARGQRRATASSRRTSGTPGQAERTAPACASAWLGIEASQAWASRDRVRWRYQLGQCRTSSWSSPVSPLPPRGTAPRRSAGSRSRPGRRSPPGHRRSRTRRPAGGPGRHPPPSRPGRAAAAGGPGWPPPPPPPPASRSRAPPGRAGPAGARPPAGGIPAGRSARGRRGRPHQRSRSSCVVTPSVEGTPIPPVRQAWQVRLQYWRVRG
jgi:hypothetical protein